MMSANKTYLRGFCGNSSFWNDDVFTGEYPNFTDCFQITLLSWFPVAWLVLTLPFYLNQLFRKSVAFPLPVTVISVLKSICCLVLFALVLLEIWAANYYGYRCHKDIYPTTAYYVSSVAYACTYLFLSVFIQYLRIKSVVSSTIIFTYWVFLTLCGVIPLQTKISYQTYCPCSIIHYVYYAVIIVQLILHCFADKSSRIGYRLLGKTPCPDSEVSTFSYWIFWWFNPVVWKAYRGKLQIDSLWENSTSLQYENVVQKFSTEWDKEIRTCIKKRNKALRAPKTQKFYLESTEETPLLSNQESKNTSVSDAIASHKPSLYRTLWRLYALQWLWGSVLNILGAGSIMLQPYILRLLIDYIENGQSRGDPKWIGYALAVGMALVGEVTSLLFTHSINVCMTLGLRIKTALIGAIYQKSLTMSNSAKGEYTTGEIVNLMALDCLRIQNAFQFAYEVLAFWFFMAIGLYQLWELMGVATLGGVGVIIILGILNAYFGKLQQKYQQATLRFKSTRIKVLNEVLQGIKVLKMYAWEPWFSEQILSIRRKEMKYLKLIAVVTSFSVVCSVHSPFFMNYFIILVYVLMNSSRAFDAQKVFGSLSLVNILRYPLTLVPFVITGCVQAYVSVGRIQNFLWKEDINKENVTYLEESDNAISIENGVFTWNPDSHVPTLKGMNLNVMGGKLYAIVGQVGSGKSSVISAILGEMEKLQGDVKLKGSVAYVPQEAWIQNLTLRDNILFGNRYIDKKYQRIIKACALEQDLTVLSAGDMTEIGEKGINISGGQKQRVSLARAVYNNADIYLLDDPLSAVDSHVGKHLFSNVIGPEGILRHKTRVLVTHGVHWLPKVDVIIVMEDGVISDMGSYEELLYRKGAFAEFLQSVLLHDDTTDDEEDPEVSKMKDAVWEQVESVVSDGSVVTDVAIEGLSRRQSMRRLSRRNSSIIDMTQRHSKKYSRTISTEPPPAKEKQAPNIEGQLIAEESSEEGKIKFGVTLAYIKAVGILFSILIMLFISGFQGTNILGNFWLVYWTEDPYLKNSSLGNTTEYYNKNIDYLLMYTLLGVIQGVCMYLFAITAFLRIVKAAGEMHSSMLRCIIRSPMAFFDTTPVGRIMNRFSSDIDVLDDKMPTTFRLWSFMFFGLLSIIVVISVNTPEFLIAIVPIGILYITILRFYLPTARQLKRIESVTRSPVFNHFSETIGGASVIRAYRCSDRFIEECANRVNKNCAFFYAANTSARWIGLRLEFLGNLLVLAASVFAVVSPSLSGADVGLSLTYSMQIIIVLNYIIQSVSEMEMNIVSVERINEYTKLTPEAEWNLPSSRPPSNWPQSGHVIFQNYATRYREGLDLVLKGITCNIKSGEKVGIVGRTGAGKSSLTLALFRLVESSGGEIYIDDIGISDLGLHDLRSRITILPQDPVLFSGSLRSNLDPSDHYTDQQIWKALECAHLKSFVENQDSGIFYECGEGGLNLSVGQRQLVCLGRALLNKTKILVLDEATAAVDMETDELIQHTIRTEFKECTVLSIAHRLNTIMDYDRIMVLDKGKIVELDSPSTLLQNEDGVFYSMAKDANLVNTNHVKFEA